MVEVEHVLIRGEIPLALEQAVALDVRRVENLVARRRRVVERPPENLAVAHVDEQAVAVVNLRAVVVKFAFRVLAEPEHARQRRQPDGLGRLTVLVRGGDVVRFAKIRTALMLAVVVSPGRMKNSYAPAQLTLSRIA
jgi:hypothetical protein